MVHHDFFVQTDVSNRNRERDFTHGKLSHFVLVGLVATTLFVLLVVGVVRLVLHLAGQ